MKTNEGTLDRALRIIAGLVLLALTFTGTIGGLVPGLHAAGHQHLPAQGALRNAGCRFRPAAPPAA